MKSALIKHSDYLEALLQRKRHPSILIAPTNYCNFNCTYCATKHYACKHINTQLELLEKIVHDCVSNQWSFTFGQTYEPFLHPQIVQIIEMVEGYGRRFRSNTNGSLLRPKVYDLPMDLTISFSENRDDFLYRRSGYDFKRYEEDVFSFLENRLNKGITGIITLQLADYSFLENEEIAYSKEINQIEEIAEKARRIAGRMGLDAPSESIKEAIRLRKPFVLGQNGPCKIQCLSTKIMPATYEAFDDIVTMPETLQGYCDSCFTMMSIQADGGVAYCCCDPTAKNIACHITPNDDLYDVWNGIELERIRESFLNRTPPAAFCKKCLYPVSEHIKPLLTVMDRPKVKEILNGFGIYEDLPWFEMGE